MLKRSALVLLSAGVAFALTACGSDAVSSDDLESEVAAQLEELTGQAPDSVSCPDDLPAEVGAEVRCTLTAGSDTFGLTLTVTEVDGDTASFDIVVDDAPQG